MSTASPQVEHVTSRAAGGWLTSLSAVFAHQLRRTRRAWAASLAAALATPTVFFLAIGLGLGSQIDDQELASLGVDSYMDFIGPGVLIVTAMQIAASESMWPTMGLLRWQGVYKAILSSPITSAELGIAHVLGIGFRRFVASGCFLFVLAIFGSVASPLGILIVGVAALVAWAHAGPLVAFTVGLTQENLFPLVLRIVIFPLFLFSGAFFPIDDMPRAIAAIARATPTWHGVELARHLANGDLGRIDLMHVGYLLTWTVVGFYLAQRQFRKHLDV